MIESRGWPHDDDLFGGREIGQSDQLSFLILIVPRLLLKECRSSAEWRPSTRSRIRAVKYQEAPRLQALRVSRQITKQISLSISCCLARRAVACLMGLYAN